MHFSYGFERQFLSSYLEKWERQAIKIPGVTVSYVDKKVGERHTVLDYFQRYASVI